VRGYLDNAQDLKLIFLLLDARREPSEQDLQMHEWARSERFAERIVLTKSDKFSNNQLAARRKEIAAALEIDESASIAASSVTKKGIDQIRREVIARL
jgi:GTP-binding protein